MHKKAAALRHHFRTNPLLRIVGAHNGLGAKLIEKNGFDGVWASGLEISTSYAVPDANILTMTESLHAASIMNEATSLPVICDCDTGYGNASNVSHMVKKYETSGIAAVVIEDKLFPKVNSFVPGRQELAPVREFMGKLDAAKHAQTNSDFMVFARVEALIAGWGMEEALRRAWAYAEAGADGLVIHSKGTTPDELYDFMKKWKGSIPVVAIPTTYNKVTGADLAAHGIRMVIYANHGLRAAIRAMDETFAKIRETDSTAEVEGTITPMKEVFELQGMSRLKDEEKKFSRKDSVQAVIPAAGDHRLQTDLGDILKDKPLCMLSIGGKTLVDRQMDTLRSCGISDILVVGGYSSDAIRLDGATLLKNPDYADTGVVHTLFSAREALKGRFVMAYSDIIFERDIVERLLSSPHEITLVIDRAYRSLPPRAKRLDLVMTPSDRPSARKLGQQSFKPIRKIGRTLDREKADCEFIGMAFFREQGWEVFTRAWEKARSDFHGRPFYESASVEGADFNDLVQYLIDQDQPVYGLEIEHGWSEIHSREDYERVDSYFREHVKRT